MMKNPGIEWTGHRPGNWWTGVLMCKRTVECPTPGLGMIPQGACIFQMFTMKKKKPESSQGDN